MKIIGCFLLFLELKASSAESEYEIETIGKSCNHGSSRCVPVTLCSNKTESSNQFGTVDVSFDDKTKHRECHYLEKCCELESVIAKREGQSFIARNIREQSVEACVHRCQAQSPISTEYSGGTETLLPISQSCGLRNVRGIGMELTNGLDAAQFGEFPWMMALISNGTYRCGGSLIHPSVVLTAAHCVHDKSVSSLVVRAGEWDTQTTNEPFLHSDHQVKEVIIAPEFCNKNLFNDIALLILKTPIELSAHISTICLPPPNFKFINETCFATGWGADKFGHEGSERANLKKVELPIIQVSECQKQLRTTKLGDLFKLNLSFMCAGGEKDVDTCTGDGGSPLVCSIPGEENYYYQAGIVSWGIECGMNGIPGVYTNVAKFKEWIDNKMISLGYRTRSYSY